MAGNFFVVRAVGAASEAGASLVELVERGQQVNAGTRSMGMALTGCTPPAKGQPIFSLAELVGEYCTSLEMADLSITLCKVDDKLKKLWPAPAEIPARVF